MIFHNKMIFPNKELKRDFRFLPILAITFAWSIMSIQTAFGQAYTGLRDPLVPGASSDLPFVPQPTGRPVAPGNGPTALPVTPGVPGAPAAEPWIPTIPSNTINTSNSGVGLPLAPSVALPPGVLNTILSPFIPAPASTPGPDPGMLQSDGGLPNSAQYSGVNANGSLPGTGGYYTSINNVRRGGQTTYQYNQQGFPSILGGGGIGQDVVTQMGPLAGYGVPYGIPTGYGYNNGLPGTNSDNTMSAIDLGGGMRTKIGGTVIPLGQTIQDFGTNAFYNSGIGQLNMNQSTDLGQGLARTGVPYDRTTDFGLPFRQFNPANVNPQNPGALLAPKAVLTNF